MPHFFKLYTRFYNSPITLPTGNDTNLKKKETTFFVVLYDCGLNIVLLAQQPAILVFIKSNERSEYSYIGLADFVFFRKKSYNLFTLNFLFSRFDL